MSTVYYIRLKSGEKPDSILKKISSLVTGSGVLDFIKPRDFTAVKMHFGEKDNAGHIKHQWAKSVLKHVRNKTQNAFLTDTNVLYANSLRANSVDHLKLAHKHGFNIENTGVPVIIADGVTGGNWAAVEIKKRHFASVKIASDIANCDCLLALSHLTGHIQTGLAGAIKNLGMGCASRRGKFEQHSGTVPSMNKKLCIGCGNCTANCPAGAIRMQNNRADILKDLCAGCGECIVACRSNAIYTEWNETLEKLQEKMVEYAYGALKAVNFKAGYLNFLTNITKNCDCLAKRELSIVKDFGILAGSDPVSIDCASMDLLDKECGKDFLRKVYPEIDWSAQLRYAESIGLGSCSYKLTEL